jgi:hypothetical protein
LCIYTHIYIYTILGFVSDSKCDEDSNNCIEANLDVQYMMTTSKVSPTTYWYSPSAEPFHEWYIYIYIYIYICMCVYVCVCKYIQLYRLIDICTSVIGFEYKNANIYIYIYMYMYMCRLIEVANSENPPLVFSISYVIEEHHLIEFAQEYLAAFDIQAAKLGIYVCTYVCMYKFVYIYVYIYVCVYACVYTCIYMYIHIYINIHPHTYMHTYKYIHTYIYIYIHTHTYIYTFI